MDQLDGTVARLKTLGRADLFMAADHTQHYGILSRNGYGWRLGSLSLVEDHAESTPTKLVLRNNTRGRRVKLVIPDAEGAITQAAKDMGIAHIAPMFYEDSQTPPPMNLKHKFSLFIFREKKTYNASVAGPFAC